MACYYMDHCESDVQVTQVYEVHEHDVNHSTIHTPATTTTIITEVNEIDDFPSIDIDSYNKDIMKAIPQQQNSGEILAN